MYLFILSSNGFMYVSEVIIFLSFIALLADMKTPINENLEFDLNQNEDQMEQLIQNERGSSSLSVFLANQSKMNRLSKDKFNRISMWSPYNNKSQKTRQNTGSFRSGNEDVIRDTMSNDDLDLTDYFEN